MNIFESLENLNVSEECFDEILDMVEGIMDDIKAGMSPEKAKEKWVKDKNKEFLDSDKKRINAERLERKAWDVYKRRDIPFQDYLNVDAKKKKAAKENRAKFITQLKSNYHNRAGENKMVMPTYSEETPTHQTGYEKGGKKYTPKEK